MQNHRRMEAELYELRRKNYQFDKFIGWLILTSPLWILVLSFVLAYIFGRI